MECTDKFKIGDRVIMSAKGKSVLTWRYKDGWERGQVVGFSECGHYVKVRRDSESPNTESHEYHPDFWDVV